MGEGFGIEGECAENGVVGGEFFVDELRFFQVDGAVSCQDSDEGGRGGLGGGFRLGEEKGAGAAVGDEEGFFGVFDLEGNGALVGFSGADGGDGARDFFAFEVDEEIGFAEDIFLAVSGFVGVVDVEDLEIADDATLFAAAAVVDDDEVSLGCFEGVGPGADEFVVDVEGYETVFSVDTEIDVDGAFFNGGGFDGDIGEWCGGFIFAWVSADLHACGVKEEFVGVLFGVRRFIFCAESEGEVGCIFPCEIEFDSEVFGEFKFLDEGAFSVAGEGGGRM